MNLDYLIKSVNIKMQNIQKNGTPRYFNDLKNFRAKGIESELRFSKQLLDTFQFLFNDPILPEFGHDVKTIKCIDLDGAMKDDDYRTFEMFAVRILHKRNKR